MDENHLLNRLIMKVAFLTLILIALIKSDPLSDWNSNELKQTCENEFQGFPGFDFLGANNFITYNLNDDERDIENWDFRFAFRTTIRQAALVILEDIDTGNKIGLYIVNGSLEVRCEDHYVWLEESAKPLTGLVNQAKRSEVNIEFKSPTFSFTTPSDVIEMNVNECFKKTPNFERFIFGGEVIRENEDDPPIIYDNFKGQIWDIRYNGEKLLEVANVEPGETVEHILETQDCLPPFELISESCRCPEGQLIVDDDQCRSSCKCRACKNGGTCKEKKYFTECYCGVGFGGKNCELEKETCFNDTCHYRGRCERNLTLEKGVHCICDDGYEGQYCDKHTPKDYMLVILLGVLIPCLILAVGVTFFCVQKRRQENTNQEKNIPVVISSANLIEMSIQMDRSETEITTNANTEWS